MLQGQNICFLTEKIIGITLKILETQMFFT